MKNSGNFQSGSNFCIKKGVMYDSERWAWKTIQKGIMAVLKLPSSFKLHPLVRFQVNKCWWSHVEQWRIACNFNDDDETLSQIVWVNKSFPIVLSNVRAGESFSHSGISCTRRHTEGTLTWKYF